MSNDGEDELNKTNEQTKKAIKFTGELEGYVKKVGDAFATWTSLNDWLDRFVEIDNAVKGIAKNLGVSSERFGAMKTAIVDSMMGIMELGGTLDDVVKIQEDFSKTLGRNVTLSEDLSKKMFAAHQATGAEVGTIVKSFRDVGINTLGAVEGMQKVVEVSHKSGVNAAQVSSQVLSNMNYMNQFTFQGGVEGLAKMAAQAVSLRVNMSDTLKLAEELFQPEKAIEMAAAMQRLGVAQGDLLDPLRLMDLAQNDPAELQNQIVKMTEQFVRMNEKGQFEIMPGARRQLMEISKELGIGYGELTKMALGSADLSKKMREIRFPSDIADEDTRKMIANMAEVGDSGTYEVKYTTDEGDTVTKKVSELGPEDIKALQRQQEKSSMSLEDVSRKQLTLQESMDVSLRLIAGRPGYAMASSKIATRTLSAMEQATQLGPKMLSGKQLSTKAIRENLGGALETSGKKISDLLEGKTDMKSFFESLGAVETKLKDWGSEAMTEAYVNMKTGLEGINKNLGPFGNLLEKITGKIGDIEKLNPNKGNNEIELEDFIIKPLPQDTVKIVGGTNLDGNKNQTPTSEVKADLNIKLETNNPNIDTNMVLDMMRSVAYKEQLMTVLKDAVLNGKTGQIGNAVTV